MRQDDLIVSEFERLNRVLERLAGEIYGFAQICGASDAFRAEQVCMDILSRRLKEGDFDEVDLEALFLREKVLMEVWRSAFFQEVSNEEHAHERFYFLAREARAAIYLRHRSGMTFIAIGRILSLPEKEVRDLVFTARERILGRPLAKVDWGF